MNAPEPHPEGPVEVQAECTIGCDMQLPVRPADVDEVVHYVCVGIQTALAPGASVHNLRCSVTHPPGNRVRHLEVAYWKWDPNPLEGSLTLNLH
jgi:hypothetical protein